MPDESRHDAFDAVLLSPAGAFGTGGASDAPLPRWWQTGIPVVDLEAAAPDAPYILECEEFVLPWRRCEVPVAALAEIAGPDWDTVRATMCPSASREAEAERFARIAAWMADVGGGSMALAQCPVLLFMDPATAALQLLDGGHRIALAVHQFGRRTISAVVAPRSAWHWQRP